MSKEAFGIDVSRYQKGMNMKKALGEGAEFVIIKASQNDFTDPEFNAHYNAARGAGLKIGAYHYLTATSVADAKKEAAYFVKALGGKKFEYPVFADAEDASLKALDKKTVTDIVNAFCLDVERAGYWCGVYCNYDFYKNHFDGESVAKRFSLWLASWTKTCPIDCQMWQFGGETNLLRSNTVAGMVCDQNRSFRDFETLIAGKGLNNLSKSAAPSAPASKPAGASGASVSFKVGDRVRLKSDAVIWGTSDRYASWVYSAQLYLRELSGSRAVISTLKSGAVTGAVDVKYLTKE